MADLSRNYRIKVHSETVSKKEREKKRRDKFSTVSSVFLTIYSSSFTPLGASWRPCSCWYLPLDSHQKVSSHRLLVILYSTLVFLLPLS